MKIEKNIDNHYEISIDDELKAYELMRKLVSQNIQIDKFELKKPSLNDIFIEKVGEQMKDLFVVAKFTIKDMIKRKSFIISTLIILLMIVLAFNIPNIIKMIKGEDVESQNAKLLVVDSNNIYE